MKKPAKKVKEYYDYSKCADYIAHKLGIEDLNDIDNSHRDPAAEYKNFWHFLVDQKEIHNGMFVDFRYWEDNLPNDVLPEKYQIKPWQDRIVRAFIEEFGEDAEYWVWW